MTIRNKALRVVLLVLLLSACKQETQDAGPKYKSFDDKNTSKPICHFAVHPLHNPTLLVKAYQPLIDILNNRVPHFRFQLEASRDYASFEAKYREKKPEFLLPNPWQTLEAMTCGYDVIAMAGDPKDFKGIFIIRKNSNIKNPADLKGKTLSYPAPTALAACIMPQYFLHEHGINVNKDIQNLYVGSQESAIMNVFIGKTDAGATWPPPWRTFQQNHPKEAAELRVIWETPPLINNSVMVRKDISEAVKQQVRNVLLKLHESPDGQVILAGMQTSFFSEAFNKNYDMVKTYVARFEKDVRKVQSP